jgi:hypothetical protein
MELAMRSYHCVKETRFLFIIGKILIREKCVDFRQLLRMELSRSFQLYINNILL